MTIGGRVCYSAALVVITCACAVTPAPAQPPAPACGTEEVARGVVSRVSDGRTVTLADGREVRLAGIEVPPFPTPPDANAPPGGAAAKAALEALAGGGELVLRAAQAQPDRYGRTVAYAYKVRAGDELFVQGELLAAGFARVDDRAGGRACVAELLKREQAARRARLGLWADPYYAVLDAGTPATVLAQNGRFALVEGKVVSVRESGGNIYVNFGRRWTEDFTAIVPKRDEGSFTGAGLDPKRLQGRRIRVRGFVEGRGGPRRRLVAG